MARLFAEKTFAHLPGLKPVQADNDFRLSLAMVGVHGPGTLNPKP